ncbi:MAG: Two-component transcriptional response regulator PdtaR, LuxR family, partial [uncultured Nocardioidaceae bacterium]
GHRRGRGAHQDGSRRDAVRGGVRRRRPSPGRRAGGLPGRGAPSGPGDPRRQDAAAGRDHGCRAHRRAAHRPGGHPHRVQPARPRGARPRRRCDGLPRQAVLQERPGARDRDGDEPVRRGPAARGGGRRPHRAAGDPQGGGSREERPAGAPRPQRARRLPVDPEDRHGPAAVDAAGGRRRDRARTGPHRSRL